MSADATAYAPPAGSQRQPLPVDVDEHECLRVPVTVATVWLFPWSERPGTTFAMVDRPGELDRAHLAPATVDALLKIAVDVERANLATSPAWPVVDGPTPTPTVRQ